MCKKYVDNKWYSLKTIKSCRYSIRAGRSVVIKQWFVHELCGGEQTYVQCVYNQYFTLVWSPELTFVSEKTKKNTVLHLNLKILRDAKLTSDSLCNSWNPSPLHNPLNVLNVSGLLTNEALKCVCYKILIDWKNNPFNICIWLLFFIYTLLWSRCITSLGVCLHQ